MKAGFLPLLVLILATVVTTPALGQQIIASPSIGTGNFSIVTTGKSGAAANAKVGCTINGTYYAQGSPGFVQNCTPPAAGTVAGPLACAHMGFTFSTTICGQNIPISIPNMLGNRPLTMPPPYLPDPISMQCVSRGDGTYYWLPDVSHVTCQLMKCPAGKVQVCGEELAVPEGTLVGQSIRLAIPLEMMPVGYDKPPLLVNAQCVYDSTNGAHYQADDLPLACSDLACPDSHLNLCGISIPLKGGASLGQNFSATLPAPFRPDPYSFSCVGQAGKAPAYMLTNTTQVTCSAP